MFHAVLRSCYLIRSAPGDGLHTAPRVNVFAFVYILSFWIEVQSDIAQFAWLIVQSHATYEGFVWRQSPQPSLHRHGDLFSDDMLGS